MSHRHFCDAAGHDWYCDGKALRSDVSDTEPSICMCLIHHVPMEEGDHRSCPVELLACPEHRDEQQRKMKEAARITPLELVGTWLSLVEHSLGVRGVGSSNLPVPTNQFKSVASG
jgi:hypothetical protein